MTAEIINLRRARKAKARDDREKDAAANRAAFGRTKAEKQASEAERLKAGRALDQANGIATTGSAGSAGQPAGQELKRN